MAKKIKVKTNRAAAKRFRPIMMTTFAAMAGAAPLALAAWRFRA